MTRTLILAGTIIALGMAARSAKAQSDEDNTMPADMEDYAALQAQAAPDSITFNLVASPQVLNCLRASPNVMPTATATVVRGQHNDVLTLQVHNVKPFLAFDMFTVERSPFLANGAPDPNFKGNFGMAWYQSDIQAGPRGNADRNHSNYTA